MPKEVLIPLQVKSSAVVIPKRPALPISTLNKKSSPDVVMKAYVTSLTIEKNYCDELESIINAKN